MVSTGRIQRRMSHMFDDASDALSRPMQSVTHRPLATAGMIMGILALVGLILMLPSIRRYIRISTM
jgi:hypothetical protein